MPRTRSNPEETASNSSAGEESGNDNSGEDQATPPGSASALSATHSAFESENQRMLEEIKLQRAILVNDKLKKKLKNLKVDNISLSELRKNKKLNKKAKTVESDLAGDLFQDSSDSHSSSDSDTSSTSEDHKNK